MTDTETTPVDLVLIVEDDQDLRESIEAALAVRGHHVATACNGVEALAFLRAQTVAPRLVLLDLMMPNMNGFDLRAEMNAHPALAAIPVVVITGAPVLAERRSAELQTEVLAKPIELGTLMTTVGRFCRPRGSARRAPV